MKKAPLGKHYLIDFYECDRALINDIEKIRLLMLKTAALIPTKVVNQVFHPFSPYGISGVIVISESHFAIHTWPEHGLVSIDLFTCNPKMNIDRALTFLKESLGANRIKTHTVDRGDEL